MNFCTLEMTTPLFTFIENGKATRLKKIPCIKKANRFKRLGVAQGMNLAHCFYLGRKFTNDFMNKVAAYKIDSGQRGCVMTVTFYQSKNSKLA